MPRRDRWSAADCRRHLNLTLFLLAAVAAGCADREAVDDYPPTARPDIVEALRADLAAERHPADGGGSAVLVEATPAIAGQPGRWVVDFTVGPQGIEEGGGIYFQVSPFWGWSTPQVDDPGWPGYTRVSTVPNLEVRATTIDSQLLLITADEALAPGVVVRIEYGAGFPESGGAIADTFRDHQARLWIGVDGDGDGVRKWLAGSPTLSVGAGPAKQWLARLPATAEEGDEVRLRVAALDALGSLSTWSGKAELALPAGLSGPDELAIVEGIGSALIEVVKEGLHRIGVGGGDLTSTDSNPMLASGAFPRLLWGDLHGHTGLSDGTGTPEDYFDYARDVAGLDFAAITDHDHWGIEPLDRTPANWQRIVQSVAAAHSPPDFVALLGYEWTNWIYGHRHVVHFANDGPLISSIDPESEHPNQLWRALSGLPSLTFAHHSAGEPVATDWSIRPDEVLEPVTEVVSVHGSSEAADARRPVSGSRSGRYVRDALDRGYVLGFIGSGDSHDGHPGEAHLAAPSGGLAAVFAGDNSRQAILDALRARRTYATDGARILLRARLDGQEMGSRVDRADAARLHVFVAGTAEVESIEAIADGQVITVDRPQPGATVVWDAVVDTTRLRYLYVRVRQRGYGTAWSSPFFFNP